MLVAEVGTRVLQVLVEKQLVQLPGEVVVMRHMILRASDGVRLLQRPQGARDPPEHRLQGIGPQRPAIEVEQLQEVVQRAIVERQRAIHVGFAEAQVRVEEQFPRQRGVMQPHGHDRSGRAPEGLTPIPVVIDVQGAGLNEPPEHVREWKHANSPNGPGAKRGEPYQGCRFVSK